MGDEGGSAPAGNEELAYPPRRPVTSARTVALVALVVAAVVGLTVVRVRDRDPSAGAPGASGSLGSPPRASAGSGTSAVSGTSAPRPVPRAYPAGPIHVAIAQVCGGGCAVSAAAPRQVRAARHAVDRLRDVQVRIVDPRSPGHDRALVVAVVARDGAQLLAVLSPGAIRIDPTRLGIVPPIGVQSQRDGRRRLVVVVSGTVDAVALLSRPSVQRWLAGLTPSR